MIDPSAKDSMLLEEKTVETDDKMEEKVDNDVLNKSMESVDSLEHFQLRISDDESTNKHGGSPNQVDMADKTEINIRFMETTRGNKLLLLEDYKFTNDRRCFQNGLVCWHCMNPYCDAILYTDYDMNYKEHLSNKLQHAHKPVFKRNLASQILSGNVIKEALKSPTLNLSVLVKRLHKEMDEDYRLCLSQNEIKKIIARAKALINKAKRYKLNSPGVAPYNKRNEAPEDFNNRMDVDQSSDNCKSADSKLEEGCNNLIAFTPSNDSTKSTPNVMECENEEVKTPLTNGISGSENEEETNNELMDENSAEKVQNDEEVVKISTSEENDDVHNKEKEEESTENDNEKTEKIENNEVILNIEKPGPTSEDDDRLTGDVDLTDDVSKQPVENSSDNDKTMDDESKIADQNSDGSETSISEAKKRQRLADDSECESIETGSKKIKKNFFSGMPQSEEQINQEIKSLDDKLNSLDVLKDARNKAASLSDEESRHQERDKAREKQMRENVLRVIQRDYQNMSVEDFEDAIYVAIMDYFCNYNPSALLQRKVLMLEKLVATLQENYHRTVKQFSEAKYLLKRMVEIRKDDLNKCSCQNKVPFKLIRSVAVQVQTSRCRGGDFCPGSEEGLRPKTKQPPDTNLNGLKQKKTVSQEITQENNNSNPPTPFSNKENSQSTTTPVSQQPAVPRHISVSVPPNRMLLRQKSSTDLQNVPPTAGTSTSQSTPRRPSQVILNKTNGASPPKPNSSFVIDLTEKEEEVSVKKAAVSTPPPSIVTAKPSTPVQQPIQTRVVKTSVLSPMPQLPPLPPAPYYKASVRRPPQPVLKVCKADQSGIMLSWTLRTNVPLPNEILFYQVYACQENAGVTREWSTVGDVKALPLPMACTLSQFREGHRYHFVVRAVDRYKVLGEFSHPASILLVSKSGGTSNHAVTAASTSQAR